MRHALCVFSRDGLDDSLEILMGIVFDFNLPLFPFGYDVNFRPQVLPQRVLKAAQLAFYFSSSSVLGHRFFGFL